MNRDRFLFLDDLREPMDVYGYTKDVTYSRLNWDIVRSYDEFVGYIYRYGLPRLVSFDHDLAPSHYTPEYLWCDYEKSKAWQELQESTHTEKTGLACAAFLVEHCEKIGERLPVFMCHSQNPVGKDKILKVLNDYKLKKL